MASKAAGDAGAAFTSSDALSRPSKSTLKTLVLGEV
jgi:hypothetical protein